MSRNSDGRQVNLVCVGCGAWGRNLVRNFTESAQANVIGFCRATPEKLEAMRADYPSARLYPTMADVVGDADVDAVAIATPAPTHYELSRLALEAGKHVFVEKPMTLRMSEARELVTLAEGRGLVLMVGHLLEYSPAVGALKQAITQGAVGPVLHIHAERLKLGTVRSEENVLWSFAPHDISVIGFLLGERATVREVTAVGDCHVQSGIEDIVHVDLTYSNGVTAHIHVSWLHPEKRRFVVVVGEQGMLVWDDLADANQVTLHKKAADPETLATSDGGAQPVEVPVGEPLRIECGHFLSSILEGSQPLSDGRDGLRVIEVLEKATAALQRVAPGPDHT